MAAIASAANAVSPSGAEGANLGDSNVSSPLSDVVDGDANDESIEHMQLDTRADYNDSSSLSGAGNRPGGHHDNSDSESALSEAASDANDTEAETERLYDTPRNNRQRDVIVDNLNQGQIFEHTPTKQRRATRLQAQPHVSEAASVSGDEALAASSQGHAGDSTGKLLSTKQAITAGQNDKEESPERKRKRSPAADNSESDQPLRKRIAPIGGPNAKSDDDARIKDDGDDDETAALANPPTRLPSGGKEENRQGAVVEATESEPPLAKKSTRSSSKRKGVSDNEIRAEAEEEAVDEVASAPTQEEAEAAEEEGDGEGDGEAEGEADAAAKNIEENERKNAAFRDWRHIEDMFGIFRERLYKDRIQRLEEEEQSLVADEPTHPEYLNMKQCIDERLRKKLQETDAEFDFRMRAHERRAVAQRAQIWSQFFQAVREKRELALEKLNKQWYEVQGARRNAHSLPEYGLLFPKDATQRVKNAIAYNSEVSTLAGLAKYAGFPAGPEIKGASAAEAEADLATIEQVRRGRLKHMLQSSREDHSSPAFHRLGPAGEQFIKNTPWANPNHSAHKLQQHPAPSCIPMEVRTEQSTAAAAAAARRTRPGKGSTSGEAKDLLEKPSTRRKSPALPGRLSDSPESARSLLKPAVHQLKKAGGAAGVGRGPKTAAT